MVVVFDVCPFAFLKKKGCHVGLTVGYSIALYSGMDSVLSG
jgi:hypothetical protein